MSITIGLAACGGGGGDSGSANGAGGTPAATPAPVPVQAAAAVITTQPAAQASAIGASVTFSVGAAGSDLAYQWRRDGRDIPGATAASYTLNDVQATDDGAMFTVVVRNGAGSVVSAGAALQVALPKGLSLVAGQLGGPGNLDGRDGRLGYVFAAGVSPSGLVVVADAESWNAGPGKLRTVDPATGIVATLQSYDRETFVRAIRFDAAGNRLELTRTGIYKTTPGGARTLLAGADGGEGPTTIVPVDGAGAAARFGSAVDMTIDGAGNLYVADLANGSIRKIDPAGNVVTLAGGVKDATESVDGRGARASFQYPFRLAVDPAGNVFVMDRAADADSLLLRDVVLLRKVAPDGTVTTLPLKAADGAGPVARFGTTGGALAFNATGTLYVTDTSAGCRVRKIGADGTVTDVAGSAAAIGNADGKGNAARFCGTLGIRMSDLAADRNGNLIVVDGDNSTLRRVTPSGEVTTIGGRAAAVANIDGRGPAASFAFASVPNPSSLDFFVRRYTMTSDAQGTLYVGAGDRIRKVGAAGDVATLPRAPDAARDARYYPGGLAWGRDAIVVSNNVVNRVDGNGTLHFVAGQPAPSHKMRDGAGATADFANPYDLVMDGLGTIYLHDTFGGLEFPWAYQRRIGADGTVAPLTWTGFYNPIRVWTADKDGNLLSAHEDGSVSLTDRNGERTNLRAPTSTALDEMATAVTRDAAGNVYLATMRFEEGSTPWYLVRKIARDRTETIVAGTKGSAGVRLGSPGSLGRVDALAVRADGVLYLMTENAVLRLQQ